MIKLSLQILKNRVCSFSCFIFRLNNISSDSTNIIKKDNIYLVSKNEKYNTDYHPCL